MRFEIESEKSRGLKRRAEIGKSVLSIWKSRGRVQESGVLKESLSREAWSTIMTHVWESGWDNIIRERGKGTFNFFFDVQVSYSWASLVAMLIKNPPAIQESLVWLGRSPGEAKGDFVFHSSILAWKIPWTIESTGSERVRDDWVTFTFISIK